MKQVITTNNQLKVIFPQMTICDSQKSLWFNFRSFARSSKNTRWRLYSFNEIEVEFFCTKLDRNYAVNYMNYMNYINIQQKTRKCHECALHGTQAGWLAFIMVIIWKIWMNECRMQCEICLDMNERFLPPFIFYVPNYMMRWIWMHYSCDDADDGNVIDVDFIYEQHFQFNFIS